MRFAFIQLRNVVMAFAVLLLGLVVVAAPAGAADSTLPSGYYLCHATGNAASVETVRNWVYNGPSDSGQASGHADPGHQNGLDIVPPIPGVLPDGQNWTAYGQQVHANGCVIPTYLDVSVTFTDQGCTQANAYVAPSFDAPTYTGLTRVVSGLGANNAADPGETVTVTYTGTTSTIIKGADSTNSVTFTHAFPTQPSGLRDCLPQPAAETRTVARSEPSCALGGVTSWTDLYTTPFVWSDAQQTWVLGQETGPVRTNEAFVAYTDHEYFQLCAPAKPAADVRSVPMGTPSCDPAGVTSWNDVYTTEYVWSAGQRAWVLGQESGPVRADETFTAYDHDEFFELCASEQPQAESRSVAQSEPSCDPAGVTSWDDVYTTEYLWDLPNREWVLGQETGPVRSGVTFTPYTDGEFFDLCAPAQPAADERRVPQSEPSCALGGVTSWTDVYTTEYVWSAVERQWVAGQESGPVRDGGSFDAYVDEEYFELCADYQPPAETRSVPQSSSSCDLAGVTSWDDVFTTEYVWSTGEKRWVLGQETSPVRSGVTFTPYTDEEFFELCAPAQPAADERRVPQSEPSCELSGIQDWVDVYTTGYVWNAGNRDWELGEETGPARADEQFTAYTDEEYLELCAPAQPEPIVVEVAGAQASCKIRGSLTWVDVYTTEYVWNAETSAWELGEATGPVSTDETFIAYTDEELADLCTEVEGEEPPKDHEIQNPGSPEVPTVVDAGLVLHDVPSGEARHPLWLLAVGGGLGLMGAAGLRRRATATR